MKKLFLILCLLVFCISANAEKDKFVDALKNCTPYSESGVLNINGTDTRSYKQMTGWQNNRCIYKETVLFGTNKVTTKCSFTRPQIDEITSVADAYYLTLKYTDEEIDTSSVDAVKNNPLVKVLNKYLQDPDVCTMEGL